MRRRHLGIVLGVALLALPCLPSADAAIYWHVRFDKIGRAATDGSSPNGGFITGASAAGVASNGTYLFWGQPWDVGPSHRGRHRG